MAHRLDGAIIRCVFLLSIRCVLFFHTHCMFTIRAPRPDQPVDPPCVIGNFLQAGRCAMRTNQEQTPPEDDMGIVLAEPACDAGCLRCDLECAAMPQRLAWWEREIERLCREKSTKAHCLETRRQLNIALGAHEALLARYASSPRWLRRSAARA